MNSKRPDDDDDERDPADEQGAEQAVLDDDRSHWDWRRRAVGAPRHEALAQIPRLGTFMAQMPIGAFRLIQAQIIDSGLNQAQWIREAIVQRYLTDGGDVTVANMALDMLRDHRQHDVPHDHYGQPRTRKGRTSNR